MFQLLYLRFTQPRADPTAFAAMASQARGAAGQPDGEPRRRVRPDARRRAQPEQPAAAAARRRRRWTSGTSTSRWRSTRRASPTRATSRSSSSAASRSRRSSRWSRPTSPACRRRTRTRRGATSASRRPPASSRRRSQKGIAPKSQVAIVFSGPFEYDDAHRLALRTMTLLLQSRLLDAIRAGARRHLQHHRDAGRDEVPAAEYTRAHRLDLRSGAHGGARAARVRGDRGREEHAVSTRNQMADHPRRAAARVRAEQPGQRLSAQPDRRSRYEDGEAATVANALNPEPGIAALTDQSIRQAARYLDMNNYVKVTLMPKGQ